MAAAVPVARWPAPSRGRLFNPAVHDSHYGALASGHAVETHAAVSVWDKREMIRGFGATPAPGDACVVDPEARTFGNRDARMIGLSIASRCETVSRR